LVRHLVPRSYLLLMAGFAALALAVSAVGVYAPSTTPWRGGRTKSAFEWPCAERGDILAAARGDRSVGEIAGLVSLRTPGIS